MKKVKVVDLLLDVQQHSVLDIQVVEGGTMHYAEVVSIVDWEKGRIVRWMPVINAADTVAGGNGNVIGATSADSAAVLAPPHASASALLPPAAASASV